MKMRKKALISLSASALVIGVAGAANAASMDLAFAEAGMVSDRIELSDPDNDRPFAGALWVSSTGDVVGDHLNSSQSVVGTPLENRPNDANGHYAAVFNFEVTGSSGDDWDAVVAGGNWTFDAMFDGALLNDNVEPAQDVPMGPLYFSHQATFADSFGQWVQNNNSDATPGGSVGPVWTYMDLGSYNIGDDLTGTIGTFAVIAQDPDNVLGLVGNNPIDPSDDSGIYASFISTSGSGQITAVPLPAAAWAGLALLGVLGGGRTLRRKLAN